MDTAIIRQRLHNYLETAEDKKVKAIYTMMENEIAGTGFVYAKTFKAELDRRYEAYITAPSTAVPSTESKKRIKRILKAANKK